MHNQLAIFLATLLIIPYAYAFDDDRQGLVLGLGAGVHSINIQAKLNGVKSGSAQGETGMATSFKVGVGLSRNTLLYYTRDASWYSAPFSDGLVTRDVTYVVGLSGIGIAYYIDAAKRSLFFNAGIGLGDLMVPFEPNVVPDTGTAWLIGVGMQFENHFNIEAKYLSTTIQSADLPSLSIDTASPMVTLNYLFY